VINNCDDAVRVKVVLVFHVDKPCYMISTYDYHDYSWKYPGRFDGLVSC
jgi:hypothetical protein